jgi:plastocyanin
MRAALVAAACGALVGIPALARAQQDPTTGSVVAKDANANGLPSGRWEADPYTGSSSLAVATGGRVTFSYPAGNEAHILAFGGDKPTCSGLPTSSDPADWGPGWSGTCTFDHAGTYGFFCPLHPGMTGSVIVRDPPPTPTASPSYGSSPTPTPTAPQSTLAVTLPARQTGTHVRGSVQIQTAGSRLEVTVTAARSPGKPARVGHLLKRSAPSGSVAFSVPLTARARRTLTHRHKLPVKVRVALTPPGGQTLTRNVKATVRRG